MDIRITKSQELFKKSQQVLVGGVNSPVRAFGSVGGTPRFVRSGKGATLYDEDGNAYLDFVGSWGPLILGHAHPKVTEAISKAAQAGSSFGAPTQKELSLANRVIDAFPSIEKIRFVNSGTEAAQSSIRLARGYTGRDRIVKFEGCYHGHSDSLLVKAGSGGATFGVPTSLGIPKALAKQTTVLPFNDAIAVKNLFRGSGKKIAAVIIEPIAANMGVILPEKAFLRMIKQCCNDNGALLIFDEIITGFRVAFGGAQELYQIKPDLTCLGKIVGGGLPMGAYGGAAEIMDKVSPLGGVYQAGTLSGNPLAVAAGLETLTIISQKQTYPKLYAKTKYFCDALQNILRKAGKKYPLHWTTGMFTLFFNHEKVTDFKSARRSDTKAFSDYFHAMLNEGVYLPPSQFEANFISLSHTKKNLDFALNKMEGYFKR